MRRYRRQIRPLYVPRRLIGVLVAGGILATVGAATSSGDVRSVPRTAATMAPAKPQFLATLESGPLRKTTFRHKTGRLAAKGKSILIGEGDSPDGAYELAAYAAQPTKSQQQFVGGAKIATCIDLDFPSLRQPQNFSRTCFGNELSSPLHLSAISQSDSDSQAFELSGETSSRVDRVSVSYVRPDGDRMWAPGSYGLVTRRVAKATGIRHRAGELIAFLPHKVLMPTGSETGPQLAPSVVVSAYGSGGRLLDRDHWGDR